MDWASFGTTLQFCSLLQELVVVVVVVAVVVVVVVAAAHDERSLFYMLFLFCEC
jgi:hypothetical protein